MIHIKRDVLTNLINSLKILNKNTENTEIIRQMILSCYESYSISHSIQEDESVNESIEQLKQTIISYSQDSMVYQYFEKDHFEDQDLTDDQWENVCENVGRIIRYGEDPLRVLVEEIINDVKIND